MTKLELSNAIAKKTNMHTTEVEPIIEAVMDTIKKSMCEGKNIYLRGFGTFYIKKRARKPARIITRGEQIIVPAHNIVKFKPAKVFKKAVMKKVPVTDK